ncbi:MAG TPA: Gfo/Idh/MocA family oxidoreductase [Tepidisphaeraceae bacterium]|nr:Gfo/Idh/MocA family oxidoreductase [Tepidisphaeraceae bacterium]
MDKVRFGVIGLGNMGSHHVASMDSIDGAVLAAVCDANPAACDRVATKFPNVAKFGKYEDLLASGTCDAILIATPHFQHPVITDAAFAKGIHVLSEKPVAVRVSDARRTNELHKKYPQLKYSLMFQTRTFPIYQKIKQLIDDGELGSEITRITWIATNWFRTWTYYALGGWRGTWSGEGGGVLINQNPHNFDLFQWLPGMMPSRVTAIANLGKHHPIEVEDEVSAIFEYPNGATGHFITSTGEAPGTDRLEICGDRGKVVCEGGKLKLFQTRKSVRQTRETSKEAFAVMDTWEIDIPVPPTPAMAHKTVTQNFVNAILKNEPLIATGEEGIKGLEIGNAMLMAGVTRKPVDLPLDAEAYDALLKDLEKQYGGRKTLTAPVDAVVDMNASFKK